MKILLQTSDEAELLFLAGDGRLGERVFSSVADFELTGELENQIVRKVRGSHARVISRGNVSHRAFFRTRRVFPTPAEAEDYVAAAERSFPRSGTLYFVTGAGTRKLRNAVVSPPVATVRGCEARLQYQATGAEFTPLEPEFVLEGVSGLEYRTVADSAAFWFEVGFDSPTLLDGNAADGWTDPFGNLRLRFHRSENLTTWDHDWIPCPTSPETITGGYRYWARSNVPIWFFNVLVDLTITSNRYGKIITAMNVGGAAVALSFPYAIPGDAARLQADLITAGYPGAVVSSVSAPLTVGIKNHTINGAPTLNVTQSGTYVTLVKNNVGASISLPGYPYAMPAQRATLQSDLRAAGQTGAVVMLYGDEWTIFLPNRAAAGNLQRQLFVTITPDDPYPAWDFFGAYLGELTANGAAGTPGNVRPGGGVTVLPEANKQFARLGVSAGPNYLY